MGFWQGMILKDDFICAAVNSIARLKSLLSLREQRLLNKMARIEAIGEGRDVYIILNGPSLREQDLSVLKGKSVLFVNRGFKHELYIDLQPEFHVFIDPKMLSGEWPVTWIDEILEMSPNTVIAMPVAWAFVDKFQPYIKKGVRFYWMPASEPCTCLGVAGACFNFAIKQHFKQIYFTGFDANGLAFEMVNSTSHFYGVNEENGLKTTKDYVTDLFMFSRHLHDLNRLAIRCKTKNISIINLTKGGLLDMFPREDLANIS